MSRVIRLYPGNFTKSQGWFRWWVEPRRDRKRPKKKPAPEGGS